MKLKSLFFLLALTGLLFPACKDDDSQPAGVLNMIFKVEYEGQPLIMFEPVTYTDEVDMNFTRFSFFISDVELVRSGKAEKVLDVAYVNTTDAQSDPATASVGTTLGSNFAPVGEYDAIRFKIGLPPELNATNPTNYSNDHPLGEGAEYWESWKSYIFFKSEGFADTTGTGAFNYPVTHHIGSDAAMREVILQKPVEITELETTTVPVVIELKDLYFGSGQPFDLIKVPQIHSLQQMPYIEELADNLSGAFK